MAGTCIISQRIGPMLPSTTVSVLLFERFLFLLVFYVHHLCVATPAGAALDIVKGKRCIKALT